MKNNEIERYERLLIEEIREQRREETAMLSDREVLMMNPITPDDIRRFKVADISSLEYKINSLKNEIAEDEELLNESNICNEAARELRQEILQTQRELFLLCKRLEKMKEEFEAEYGYEPVTRKRHN